MPHLSSFLNEEEMGWFLKIPSGINSVFSHMCWNMTQTPQIRTVLMQLHVSFIYLNHKNIRPKFNILVRVEERVSESLPESLSVLH